MNLKCERCEADFENPSFRGYCDECIDFFKRVREKVNAAQAPRPGVIADGKFAPAHDCPRSVFDPVSNQNVCGICGSTQLEMGYGLGTGHGIGSYNFCMDCDTFLDFSEDTDE